jgi:hypothetical protein
LKKSKNKIQTTKHWKLHNFLNSIALTPNKQHPERKIEFFIYPILNLGCHHQNH